MIQQSEVLALYTPHDAYRALDLRGKPSLDIWNFWSPESAGTTAAPRQIS